MLSCVTFTRGLTMCHVPAHIYIYITQSGSLTLPQSGKAALLLSGSLMDESNTVGFDENHICRPFFLRLYFSLPINRTARSCHMWVNSPSIRSPPASVTTFLPRPHPPPSPPPRWESLCTKGRGDMSRQPIGSREEVCLQISGSQTCSCEEFSQTMGG